LRKKRESFVVRCKSRKKKRKTVLAQKKRQFRRSFLSGKKKRPRKEEVESSYHMNEKGGHIVYAHLGKKRESRISSPEEKRDLSTTPFSSYKKKRRGERSLLTTVFLYAVDMDL